MTTINLRNYYPVYMDDCYLQVTDEVARELKQWEQGEKAYQRKRKRNHAQYSLDRNDGIERDVIFSVTTPDEHYEHKLKLEQLYQTLAQLPEKQSQRIYAHYFMEISVSDIAKAEELNTSTVRRSIMRGLRALGAILKKKILARMHFSVFFCHRYMRGTLLPLPLET